MKIDKNFGELLGAFIWDGWIETRESGMYILGDPVEDMDYSKRIAGLFETIFRKKPKMRHFHSWKVYGIYTYDKKVIACAIKYGFAKGKKANTARIPDCLMNQNKEILKSIVRGIFDTDGTFHCKKGYGVYGSKFAKTPHCYPKLEITSTSKVLVSQVHSILSLVGIQNVVRIGQKENKNFKRCYRVTVYRIKDINRFFKIIKPKNQRHITRYKVWKMFGFLLPYTNITQRKKILKKEINPYIYYAEVPERSNGQDFYD